MDCPGIVHDKLAYLTDDTRAASVDFLKVLSAHNLNPKILETYRKQSRQDCLYKNFGPGSAHQKTNTDHSWHTAGRALDVSISPADLDSILFFLDTAAAFGFSTTAKGAKIRAAIAANTEADLWDWHHVSFRAGKNKLTAIAEYQELLNGAPKPDVGLLEIASKGLLIAAVIGVFYHGTKKT